MPFVRHGDEVGYLRNLRRLVARLVDFRRMSGFDFVCFKRPYDRQYLVYEAADWWREMDFEGRHRWGSQHSRFLGWHNLEVSALRHPDRDGLYASVPEAWRR